MAFLCIKDKPKNQMLNILATFHFSAKSNLILLGHMCSGSVGSALFVLSYALLCLTNEKFESSLEKCYAFWCFSNREKAILSSGLTYVYILRGGSKMNTHWESRQKGSINQIQECSQCQQRIYRQRTEISSKAVDRLIHCYGIQCRHRIKSMNHSMKSLYSDESQVFTIHRDIHPIYSSNTFLTINWSLKKNH